MRTREAVLRAAGEAFAQNGFLGTSMSDILQRAGVTKGALYFHFSSKEELAFAVVAAQKAAVTRLAEEEAAKEVPPLQAVVATTTRWARAVQSDPVVRAGVRLVAEQGAYQRPMSRPYGQWEDVLTQLLQRAQDSGQLGEGANPREAAELIVAALTGATIVAQATHGPCDLPQRVEAMWQLLLTGLLPDGHKVFVLPRTLS
ncbi:hypothetical protein AQ490_18565 [Wenjunlia vitaminophila]|uniref:HTH tetR-type domain-containing protein n=1 Tax=Wenjunlia vitaminophila TaxID=76728 RepID=A0A0T6LV51_WENVI|nr:hypothetical protein AQ490_18565 [Wenjunlia vitaminophila]